MDTDSGNDAGRWPETEKRWWYCLKHKAVEPDAGCRARDRLGPFPTPEQAAGALDRAKHRNEQWEAEDDGSSG